MIVGTKKHISEAVSNEQVCIEIDSVIDIGSGIDILLISVLISVLKLVLIILLIQII